jgi:uroporphyrinogen decarboxylase
MRSEAWERFKRVALSKNSGERHGVTIALIVDSPWLPGFMGISHIDYFTLPDQWTKANLYIEERFPNVIFLPGFWVEYGMAAEPSAFGCKIVWWKNSPPSMNPVIHDASEISRLKVPTPSTDGLMPFVLSLYRCAEKSLKGYGEHIKMVAARGPLAIAGYLRGVTELMMDLKLFPTETKRLLGITTETTIQWLRAQIQNLPEIEGVMVLDDIVGFLSPSDYLEFAHPFLKEIFSSFPDMVKVYHNDSNINHILEDLAETGFHVLNFSHNLDIGVVWQRIGNKISLMGNVPPLEVLAKGNPEEVRSWAKACITKTKGAQNLILSAGGGVSPDTPAQNIDALVEAAERA